MSLLDRLRGKRTEPSSHGPDLGRPEQGDIGGGPAGGETFLMPIEDVFTITGRGTVVTGRISRGTVRPGDRIELVRDRDRRIPAVVEGVESFRKLVDVAHTGDKVGVLVGDVNRAAVQAGMVLVAAGTSAAPPAETAASTEVQAPSPLESQASQEEQRLRQDAISPMLSAMLRPGGPATLHGYDRILAVVVMHERSVDMGLTPQRIARGFVEEFKRPGWVPSELRVEDNTPISILERPDTGQLTTDEANSLLQDAIADTLVKAALRTGAAALPSAEDLATCAAVSFSGENDVFGHSRLAILATSTDRCQTEVAGSAPGETDAGSSWGLRAAAASERNALVDARQVGRENLGEFKVYRVMAPSGETLADDDRLSIRGQLTCPTCGTKMSQRVVIDFQGFLRAGSSHYTACPNCEGLLRVTGTTTAVDGEAVRWLLLHREAGPAGVGPLPGTDDQLPHFDADVVEIVARGTGQGE